MRTALRFALILPLLAASCGGGSDPKALTDQGYAALKTNQHAAALEDFQAALDAIGSDTAHAQFKRASLGAVEAQIGVDAEKAKTEFLALASAHPSKFGDRDYSLIGGKLASAQEFMAAIAVLDAGMKAHDESPVLQGLVDSIKTAAEKAGSTDALDELASLGYL